MIAEPKPAATEPTAADLARFIRFVKPLDSGCWEWTSHRNGKGYGRFWFNGRNEYAHRFAYFAFIGPIPDGLTIHHTCTNTACVRPGHLEPATYEANAAERHEREADTEEIPF